MNYKLKYVKKNMNMLKDAELLLQMCFITMKTLNNIEKNLVHDRVLLV